MGDGSAETFDLKTVGKVAEQGERHTVGAKKGTG
jgi:hypothetical protein